MDNIKKLTSEQKADFSQMNDATVDMLVDKSFLIPFSNEEIEDLFSDNAKDVVFGIFHENEMAAMAGLYFDLRDFESQKDYLDIDFSKTGEIGGCMTSSEHRGKGYMLTLNKELTEVAREMGLKHIVATAHPENYASIKSLTRLGMRLIREFDRHGFRRNLYVMEL